MSTEIKGWRVQIVGYTEGRIEGHVVPVDDLREHDLSADCWCLPDAEDETPFLEGTAQPFLHNSADGREARENTTLH